MANEPTTDAGKGKEFVNLTKLTKLEQRVLNAIYSSWKTSYLILYPENIDIIDYQIDQGNNVHGIAVLVYGSKFLSNSIKCSLSRALNGLMKKGLVQRCQPRYSRKWDKENHYMARNILGLSCGGKHISFRSLPYYTKVWWLLTDKGTKVVEDESGVTLSRNRCARCLFSPSENGKCRRPDGNYEELTLGLPSQVGDCDVFLDKEFWRIDDDDLDFRHYRNKDTGYSTEILWNALEMQNKGDS